MQTNNEDRTAPFPKPGVSTAIFRDDQILLVQRAKGHFQGKWSLPGGHIKLGEDIRSAGLRELAEETGIIAELLGVVDIVDVILKDNQDHLIAHYVLSVFFGLWRSGKIRAGSDSAAVMWAGLNKLDTIQLTPGTRDVILKAANLI